MNYPINDITILVASRNRENYLIKLLDSISKLKIPPEVNVEAIIVDNASIDTTPQIIQNFQCSFPLKYIYEENPGKSIALNRGISESKGDLLLFTDDDAIVEKNWLIEYWRAANLYPDAGYFFGKIQPIFLHQNPPPWWNLAPRSLKGRDQGEKVIRFTEYCSDSMPIGINMAILRKAIPPREPFDENLGPSPITKLTGGADTKLGLRITMWGYPSYYIHSSIVYHHVSQDRLKWSYLTKRAHLDGRGSVRALDMKGKKITLLGVPIRLLFWLLKKTLLLPIGYISGKEMRTRELFLEIMYIAGQCKEYRISSKN